MRDEFLAAEIFYSLKEVEVLIEMWRRHYPVPGRCNTVRPHSSLRYRPQFRLHSSLNLPGFKQWD